MDEDGDLRDDDGPLGAAQVEDHVRVDEVAVRPPAQLRHSRGANLYAGGEHPQSGGISHTGTVQVCAMRKSWIQRLAHSTDIFCTRTEWINRKSAQEGTLTPEEMRTRDMMRKTGAPMPYVHAAMSHQSFSGLLARLVSPTVLEGSVFVTAEQKRACSME